MKYLLALLVIVFSPAWSSDFETAMQGQGIFKACTPIAIAAGRAMEGYQYELSEGLSISLADKVLNNNLDYVDRSRAQVRRDLTILFDLAYDLADYDLQSDKKDKTRSTHWSAVYAFSRCAAPKVELPSHYSDLNAQQRACVDSGILFQEVMLNVQADGAKKASSYYMRTKKGRVLEQAKSAIVEASDFPKGQSWGRKAFNSYWFGYTESFECLVTSR